MPPIFTIEKREAVHSQLLQSGITLIKEVGIKKMSIDKVTQRTGIGKGTFYHFFPSKEYFVTEVIRYSKERIYEFINKAVEEKGGIDKETFLECMHTFAMNQSNNIISYITKEDIAWLSDKMPEAYELNPEKEDQIMHVIFSHAIGLRKDINYHVVANSMKVMALAVENKSQLYEEVLQDNIGLIIESLGRYLYE